MAGSSSHQTHMPSSSPSSSSLPTKPPKSKSIFTTYFFSKSLIIILVLLLFFFFPAQVPETFKETTILTKLWDLIYLLVIGIAVCYGLFSRKIDGVHSADESAHYGDNFGEKDAYLSGISHISSIFEDGYQNSYGFEEKSLLEECKGSGSRFSEIGDGFGKSDGKKMNQYFLGESMVVINDENYVLEQLGRQKTSKQNKPLGLRVRNLGSKSLDSAAGKSSVEDSLSGWDEVKKGKFRGLVPIKLEEKFKETDSDSDTDTDSRTRVDWRSKSMRLEKREDMITTEPNEASHFRPVSVGAFDFEGLKSQSMRSEMPSKKKNVSKKEEFKGIEVNNRYMKPYLNSETSYMQSKPQESSTGGFSEMNDRLRAAEMKDFSGTLDGSSEEFMKDFGKNKVNDGTFDSRNNAQFVKSKSQSSSIGASSERNMEETFKNMLRKEEKANIQKPATLANAYRKGKSVRTNRSKEQGLEAKVKTFQSQTDDKVEARSELGINETNTKADELSDTEPHSGEVDRKAEEFIAKFKEQIRLQKVASARKLNLL